MFKQYIDRLTSDEQGVSPVIGVILMVAITVILAAVIAAFVLGFGADTESAPQASHSLDAELDADNDSDNNSFVEITHEGGATFDADNTEQFYLSIAGERVEETKDDLPFSGGQSIAWGDEDEDFQEKVNELDDDRVTVRVIWEGTGGTTATIAERSFNVDNVEE